MKRVQFDETLYLSAISKRCNLIQRYNIWYNNPIISLLFYALFYPLKKYKYLINKYFGAKCDIRFNTFNNIVFAKGGVESLIEKPVAISRNLLFILYFFVI